MKETKQINLNNLNSEELHKLFMAFNRRDKKIKLNGVEYAVLNYKNNEGKELINL